MNDWRGAFGLSIDEREGMADEGEWRATELREAFPAVMTELREPPDELVVWKGFGNAPLLR